MAYARCFFVFELIFYFAFFVIICSRDSCVIESFIEFKIRSPKTCSRNFQCCFCWIFESSYNKLRRLLLCRSFYIFNSLVTSRKLWICIEILTTSVNVFLFICSNKSNLLLSLEVSFVFFSLIVQLIILFIAFASDLPSFSPSNSSIVRFVFFWLLLFVSLRWLFISLLCKMLFIMSPKFAPFCSSLSGFFLSWGCFFVFHLVKHSLNRKIYNTIVLSQVSCQR